MDDNIRRSGKLYLHQKRFGKRWRKVWCVLVAEGRRSVARLELYEHKYTSVKEGSSKSKPDYKQVIRLRECIRISETKMADCPKDCATFLLETSDKLYVFAAHQLEVEEWIKCLCEQAFPETQRLPGQSSISSEPVSNYREIQDNCLYDTADSVREFLVIAVSTEAAFRCNLNGEFILSAQPDCLLLKDPNTREVLFKWPYCYVRKFGQDTLSFSFEAGRRCESGEGYFEFATHQGERLFSIVNAAIQHLPKSSAVANSRCIREIPSRFQETASEADEMYDDITVSIKPSDCLHQDKRAVQHPSKRINAATRSMSLNEIQPFSQMTSITTDNENEEPLYATVSKAQPKTTSPTNTQTHWKNLRKALHQSSQATADIDTLKSSAFVVPQEEAVTGEDSTDLLSGSIHQLAINDALNNIGEEAIYADPQDLEPRAEWDVNAIYDDPEDAIMSNQNVHDGADWSDEHDFYYNTDTPSAQVMAAQSSPSQSSDGICSTYDNLKLKGRRM